jgi:putative DNA primase/helicase
MADDISKIVALAEVQSKRSRRQVPPGSAKSDRPLVRLEPGALPRAVEEAEAALVAADKNLYRYGNKLVTIVWDDIRIAGGGREQALRLSPITVPALLDRLDRAVRFEKWSGTAGDYVVCHCPREIAERYLVRDGEWNVPSLLGVVTAPTLRDDGTILDVPGYDPVSGLVFMPLGIVFPAILAAPTKADAEAALGRIGELIAKFPFANGASRAVALSGILTAISRRALPTAPMHCYDAPVAGSGKSKLVDIAAVIATGHQAAVIATGSARDGEFEKRLAAALLGGDPIIALDNLEVPVGGQLLNQILTQYAVTIRPFGKLENVVVPCTASVFANGNNLAIDGDLTRRSLVGRLDPGVERPELLEFDFDPVARAKAERPQLLLDGLTVLRAWIVAGEQDVMPPPLGSYERWSRVVRNALIWPGEPDPVEVMEEVRGTDPKLSALRAMMMAWRRVLWANCTVTVRDVISAAVKEQAITKDGVEIRIRMHPDLYEALEAVTEGRERAKSLGWWLRGQRGRVVTIGEKRFRFVQDPTPGKHASEWMLEALDAAGPDGGEDLPLLDRALDAAGSDGSIPY